MHIAAIQKVFVVLIAHFLFTLKAKNLVFRYISFCPAQLYIVAGLLELIRSYRKLEITENEITNKIHVQDIV